MADETQRGGRRTAVAEDARKDTKRVVLKRERVLVLGDDVAPEKVAEAAKLLGLKNVKGDPSTLGWLVVGEFVGETKDKAIEAHAGKPGTPDAKQGAFKAPTASAWAGGALYKAPPAPLVEKEAIE